MALAAAAAVVFGNLLLHDANDNLKSSDLDPPEGNAAGSATSAPTGYVPVDMQLRVFEDTLSYGCPHGLFGLVSAVNAWGRETALSKVLLANMQDTEAPFAEGEDGPPPLPTWRVRHMRPAPLPLPALLPVAEPFLAADRMSLAATLPTADATCIAADALHKVGQRYKQLQHISVDLTPPTPASTPGRKWDAHASAWAPVGEGLAMFTQHVVPALVAVTRLTIRGRLDTLCRWAPMQGPLEQLAATRLGAAVTHLDFTGDAGSAAYLLRHLVHLFPAVTDARVRLHSPETRDFHVGVTLNAPDRLARLHVLTSSVDGEVCLSLERAAGLEDLLLRALEGPHATRVEDMGAWGNRVPALHTIRGFPVVRLNRHGPMWALRHLEATCNEVTRGNSASDRVQQWLLSFTVKAPALESLCLRFPSPWFTLEQWQELRAWSVGSLPYTLTWVEPVVHVEGCEPLRPF